jgi:glutathione S-transferase
MLGSNTFVSASVLGGLGATAIAVLTTLYLTRGPDKVQEQQQKKKEDGGKRKEKFAPKDGLTFYFFPRSPCARRVWVTLLEKKIKCEMVMVDLMNGEQRCAEYLAINPQGKVPAIRCHNHPTAPDCILYESQAIVEWLDEQFPSTPPLIPRGFDARIGVKMLQYWELSMAEDMWPLSRQQVDGIIWRFVWSREGFYSRGPPKDSSSDPFYAHKVSLVYEGTYLTPVDARRRALRTLRAFKMLDMALGDNKFKRSMGKAQVGTTSPSSASSHPDEDPNLFILKDMYMVGDSFTQADIACYPRLCKVPQNGLVSTAEERALFPHVCEYFEQLRHFSVFARFADVDEVIWQSGEYPKFVPQWWGKYVPWWLVVAVGNWRAGVSFERITQAGLGEETIQRHLDLVTTTPLSVLPTVSLHDTGAGAAFRKEKWGFVHDESDEENSSEDSSDRESLAAVDEEAAVLYAHPAMPLAVATRACLHLQTQVATLASASGSTYAAPLALRITTVDTTRLEHLSPRYLAIMPMGEVPALAHRHRVVYGPHIIVEYIDEMLFNPDAQAQGFSPTPSPSPSAPSSPGPVSSPSSPSPFTPSTAGGVKSVTWIANSDPSASAEASCRLLPSAPLDRAVVRRWFGWCRTAYFYQIEPLYNSLVLPRRMREKGIASVADLRTLAAELGVTEEEIKVFEEKCFPLATGADATTTAGENSAYVSELLVRIDTVEQELQATSNDNKGRSLLGHTHFTYADYFVLAVILLAEVYSSQPVSALKHPFVWAWKQELLRHDSIVALLFHEMVLAHGQEPISLSLYRSEKRENNNSLKEEDGDTKQAAPTEPEEGAAGTSWLWPF